MSRTLEAKDSRIEVIEPQNLREDIISEIEKIKNLY